MPGHASTTQLTKAKRIVAKEGDYYIKELHELEEGLSFYYKYIFGVKIESIKERGTLYMPSNLDIDIIFKKLPKKFENDTELIFNLSMLLKTTNDDYLNICIKTLRTLIVGDARYMNFLSSYSRSIVFTISYNTRVRAISDRLGLLEYIISNNKKSGFDVLNYFEGVDKPEEHIHELSCIIQNIYNRIFPGFYTYEEMRALLKLVTGKDNIAHKDIKNVRESFSPKIKRILPDPYLPVQDLLASYHGKPPSHFPF